MYQFVHSLSYENNNDKIHKIFKYKKVKMEKGNKVVFAFPLRISIKYKFRLFCQFSCYSEFLKTLIIQIIITLHGSKLNTDIYEKKYF